LLTPPFKIIRVRRSGGDDHSHRHGVDAAFAAQLRRSICVAADRDHVFWTGLHATALVACCRAGAGDLATILALTRHGCAAVSAGLSFAMRWLTGNGLVTGSTEDVSDRAAVANGAAHVLRLPVIVFLTFGKLDLTSSDCRFSSNFAYLFTQIVGAASP
jgi:hypothetical protein